MAYFSPVVFTDKRLQPFAFEQIALTASAQTLTAATYNPSTHVADGKAQAALISFEDTAATDIFRFTLDGTAPVGGATGLGKGHMLANLDSVMIVGYMLISKLQFIGANTGKISVTYFR